MKNILITSSSPSFIERNSCLIRRSNFQIFTADNSFEALDIVKNEKIDLLLVDIQLADLPGESFCTEVRNTQSDFNTVILLVCNNSDYDFERLKDSGADALLARPIKPVQLIKTVGQFLDMELVRSKRVSLRVKVISKKNNVEFFCMSQDISLTGMRIETVFFLEPGSFIDCQFSLNGSTEVVTEGVIVRSERTLAGDYQYGIQFTRVSNLFNNEIDRYISSVSSE